MADFTRLVVRPLHRYPSGGKNYYRLRQVDYDGKVTYSKVITVDMKTLTSTLSVYPNPSSGMFTVIAEEPTTLLITDVYGQKID